MSGYIGKTTNTDGTVVGRAAQDEREEQWGEMQGEIVSFDAAKQTAKVRPLYKKRLDGVPTQVPDLEEVPVRFARAGGGAMTMPVGVGDKVTLRPMMRNADAYHEGGSAYEAASTRSYSLSDMEAHLDGGESLKDPIQNFDPSNVHVRFDQAGQYGIRGSKDGKVKIEGSQGDIYDLLATFAELVASDELQIAYGSSAGTGHALKNKAQLMEIAGKLRAMAL